MKKLTRFFQIATLLVALMIAGCASDTPLEPEDTGNNATGNVGEFAGKWGANTFNMINVANPSQVIDLTVYGVEYSMTINTNATYSVSVIFQGQPIDEEGVVNFDNGTVTFTPNAGAVRTGTYTYANDILTLDVAGQEFDFNQDGVNEPAKLYLEMVKVQ